MAIKISRLQRQIISRLIDKYENSKSYNGENKVNQSFYVTPTDFLSDYYSDFADIDRVRELEEQIEALSEAELVRIVKKNGSISKIIAGDSWDRLYFAIGRSDKNAVIQDKLSQLEAIDAKNLVSKRFLEDQMLKTSLGKKSAYEVKEVEKLVLICDAILENRRDILERELSIMLLADSKAFEKQYKSKVCNIIASFSDEIMEDTAMLSPNELEHALLESHGVYANPSYIYFKGNGRITFEGDYSIDLRAGFPIAFNNESIRQIRVLEIYDKTIMTIENLTSFNRMNQIGEFYIYLGGYHNRVRQDFLKSAYETNTDKTWLHFGDIDPDGYLILDHLCQATGIPFTSFAMGTQELKDYRMYGKPLQKNDIVKANNMITAGKHSDIMNYMLENNIKLEQEAISLKLY